MHDATDHGRQPPGGWGDALARLLGENLRAAFSPGAIESGSRSTSSARARLGSRRMKPRSSSAVISRWMPDLEARSSASFISSKEGETPDS